MRAGAWAGEPGGSDPQLAALNYDQFLDRKAQLAGGSGFDPICLPEFLFPFQRNLVEWAVRSGRAAIFADCGLGKTPMQLVWPENVVRHTNKPVLIVTPLAVTYQLVHESEKFGLDCARCPDGKVGEGARILTTNYERLHLFDPNDFAGVVCDESSSIKNFNGVRRLVVTEFMRKLRYRLLCTATAAPNDYIELGTSSEALGHLGHMDMLSRFFKNDQNTNNPNRIWTGARWRFKRHAEVPFWKWVCSWARAVRRPSDLGFDDSGFVLPPYREAEHIVEARTTRDGWLFDMPAVGMREEREECRRTIQERCEKIAGLVGHDEQALVWCHMNKEGDTLERIIPGALQVSGSHDDDVKEERLGAFARGELRVLVTKPKIGAWGLNLQNCSHVTFFPTYSYESYYQGVRRCWRFGQRSPVTVDIVSTDGQAGIMAGLRRKAEQADRMFSALVEHMNESQRHSALSGYTISEVTPSWLVATK